MTDKVYISGAVSGLPLADVRRRFAEAEARTRELGYRTCNPMRMRLCVWLASHGRYRLCLMLQLLWMWWTCDIIYLQQGWHLSDGARLERAAARVFGLTAVYEGAKPKRKRANAATAEAFRRTAEAVSGFGVKADETVEAFRRMADFVSSFGAPEENNNQNE